MKNFFAIRLAFLTLAFMPLLAFADRKPAPGKQPMLNVSSVYRNSIVITRDTTNLGSQIDTTSGATPLYLSYCTVQAGRTGKVNPDTVMLAELPRNTYKTASVYVSGRAITTTDTLTVTLEQSASGVDGDWAAVPNASFNYAPTTGLSVSVYPGVSWDCKVFNFQIFSSYLRLKIVGKATKSSGVMAFIQLNP